MPDLLKVLSCIEKSEALIKEAQEAMVPFNGIRQIDAYVLGFLRAISSVLKTAKDAILQSSELRNKQKTRKQVDPEDQ
jgi:hypothetical protein